MRLANRQMDTLPVVQTSPPNEGSGMKLDVNVLRYLSKDDFRVLVAVEMGQKNVSPLLCPSYCNPACSSP